MKEIFSLIKAENTSAGNHFRKNFENRGIRIFIIITIILSLFILNFLIINVLDSLFSGAKDTLADNNISSSRSVEVLKQATSVISFALSLGAAAASLLLYLVIPLESPLLLQARMSGVSQWSCGVAKYLSQLLWSLFIGLSFIVGGAWSLANNLSEKPGVAFWGIILLSILVASLCNTLLSIFQSSFTYIIGSAESRRSLGLLSVCSIIALIFFDILNGARGEESFLRRVSNLWGGSLPDSILACILLLSLSIGVIFFGIVFSKSDHSGGNINTKKSMISFQRTPSAKLDIFLSELSQTIREPIVKVSLFTSILLAFLLVLGVFYAELHPGIAVMINVLVAAMGAEAVFGRISITAWMMKLAGVSTLKIILIKLLPFFTLQFLLLLLITSPIAFKFGGPLSWAEAISLFLLIFSVALFTGTLVPADVQAPTAMGMTSVLTLSAEILTIATVTWAFELHGWRMIAIDLILFLAFCTISILTMKKKLEKNII